MSIYQQGSIRKYLDDLAAKKPAPGGGSAAALVSGLGVALVSMVVNFTLGKPKYAQYQKKLEKCLEKAGQLRADFLEAVDLDVIAYESKDARRALDVPYKVCNLCLEAIRLCPGLITQGNKNLISDVAVAAVLLEAAFVSANFNVEINLKYIDNPALARKIRKDLGQKIKTVKKIRKETEAKVGKIIRG